MSIATVEPSEIKTVSDVRRRLQEECGEHWGIEEATLWGPKRTNHAGAVLLETTLTHETGASVESTPVDPFSHYAGEKMYRAHRVRLQHPSEGRDCYAYYTDEPALAFKEAERVHRVDEYVREVEPKGGRGTTIKHLRRALAAVIEATQQVTAIDRQRRQWFFGPC